MDTPRDPRMCTKSVGELGALSRYPTYSPLGFHPTGVPVPTSLFDSKALK